MTDSKPLRVALYARVSSEEQKQGHNIDSQLSELKHFAAQNNWTVVEAYTDEAWSGAVLARPALDRLRDDATKGLFDAVLINDVDRLARDVTHLGIIKRDLECSGVRVVFRKIPSENSPTHNLLVNILGSFAEFERELILDRMRRGKRHKVETRQQFIGAIAPFGYRYIPAIKGGNAGELRVDPEEAAVVRDMYRWVDAEGLSARRVRDRLTKMGLRPRKRGAGWAKSTVLRILRCPAYAGTWYYNKHRLSEPARMAGARGSVTRKTSLRVRPRDEWIPVTLSESLRLVSSEQWSRVQQQLNQNRSFSPRNSKHEYLLSGLVRCGGCTAPYVGNPSHGWFQYRCASRCKRLPLVSEGVLDNTVWTALQKALSNPDVLEQAIQDIRQPAAPSNDDSRLQEALAGIRAEETRILEAYRLEILSAEQLASELQSISSRRKFFEAQSKTLDAQSPKIAVHKTVQEYCSEMRQRLSLVSPDTRRAVVRLIVRRVVFEGSSVRIVGIIPLKDEGGISSTAPRDYVRSPAGDGGGIAATTREYCGGLLMPVSMKSSRYVLQWLLISGLGGILTCLYFPRTERYPLKNAAERRRPPTVYEYLGEHVPRTDLVGRGTPVCLGRYGALFRPRATVSVGERTRSPRR